MLLHESAERTRAWLDGWKLEPIIWAPLGMLILAWVAWNSDPAAVRATFAGVVALSPIWLPLSLAVSSWKVWMHYIRYMFWFNQEWVLLEIQLPPEVQKSPLAMELFLTALWNAGGETTFIQRIWKGQFRPVWSLEIASNEGRISFYMHMRKGWKNITEARLYGQFPEAKVTEVEDYVAKVPFNLEEYELFGCEYQKGEPQALPLRSYIDYGLDKNPDTPEIQVDPLTNLLEFLSTAGPGEFLWLQLVIQARKKDQWYGFYYNKRDDFKDPAKKAIQAITEGAIVRAQEFVTDEAEKKKVGSRGAMLLTGGEKLRVEAIERSLTKLVFECGIRVIYMAKRSNFNGVKIGGLIRFFDANRYPDYNALGVTRSVQNFDYPWQDFMNIRKSKVKRDMFFQQKNRAYFYVPYDQKPVFLTTEELATLWHFPNSFVKTPGLERVASRVSEGPTNLPTLPS